MLAKSHGNKSKADRKAKKSPGTKGMPTLTDKYNKADALVEQCYCDIANGVSRSVVIDKITKGVYDGMERPLAARTAAYYYNAALDRFAVDTDIEAEKLRKMFYGRYEALLEEAVKKGDIYNARGILDSMSRIFGIERKAPDTAIQIVNNKEGININFGFDDKDEKNVDNAT
jgi:hypothetical protein